MAAIVPGRCTQNGQRGILRDVDAGGAAICCAGGACQGVLGILGQGQRQAGAGGQLDSALGVRGADIYPVQRQVGTDIFRDHDLPGDGAFRSSAGDGQGCARLDGQRIVVKFVVRSALAAHNCKAAVRQSICHPIEHCKQGVKNLCSNDFRFLLVRQDFICVIGFA